MSRRWHHWRRKWRPRKAYRPPEPSRLDAAIEVAKQRLETTTGDERRVQLEKLLVLQTPRAAAAQMEMDEHQHNYHDREKRLYELIDFNDTFVAAVLMQPAENLAGFADRMKHAMSAFCASEHAAMFRDEQYDAIVRGLAREIAVYLGARREGLEAMMTSRTEDAFGIDMVIRDPASDTHIDIDVKTPSAFRYRLEDLVKEGRITDQQLVEADTKDFVTVINRRNDEQVPVTILCVRPEDLGDIVDFQFQNSKKLGLLLRRIIAHDGQK